MNPVEGQRGNLARKREGQSASFEDDDVLGAFCKRRVGARRGEDIDVLGEVVGTRDGDARAEVPCGNLENAALEVRGEVEDERETFVHEQFVREEVDRFDDPVGEDAPGEFGPSVFGVAHECGGASGGGQFLKKRAHFCACAHGSIHVSVSRPR